MQAHNTLRGRECVSLARELLGGNGILYDNTVARHFADMEAIYTFEGTYEINTLALAVPPHGMISKDPIISYLCAAYVAAK